jgi:hypothetical protein
MKTKKDKYHHTLTRDQKERLPLPYLLAKKNKKKSIPYEEKHIQNLVYETSEYIAIDFFKNIITPIPGDILDQVKNDEY